MWSIFLSPIYSKKAHVSTEYIYATYPLTVYIIIKNTVIFLTAGRRLELQVPINIHQMLIQQTFHRAEFPPRPPENSTLKFLQ